MPDSFPARLGPDCGAPGTTQRRFIVIDEAVHALYGEQMDKVTAVTPWLHSCLCRPSKTDGSSRHAAETHSRVDTALWANIDCRPILFIKMMPCKPAAHQKLPC